jgi:hypothetical protein
MDEVHGPDLIGCGSRTTIVAQLRLRSSPWRLVAQLQAQFVVNAMGFLQIDLPYGELTTKRGEQTSILRQGETPNNPAGCMARLVECE